MAQLLKDCKQLQQVEADFMNEEWLLFHWSKLKTQIFREVAERKAKEAAAMQAALANPAVNGVPLQHIQGSADQSMHTTNMEISSSSTYSEATNGQHPTEIDQGTSNQYASALLAPPPPAPPALAPAPPAAPRMWTAGERIEAQDRNGDWYRSTVVATSLTGKQVQHEQNSRTREVHAAHNGMLQLNKHLCAFSCFVRPRAEQT
jgi:hypothetical protein